MKIEVLNKSDYSFIGITGEYGMGTLVIDADPTMNEDRAKELVKGRLDGLDSEDAKTAHSAKFIRSIISKAEYDELMSGVIETSAKPMTTRERFAHMVASWLRKDASDLKINEVAEYEAKRLGGKYLTLYMGMSDKSFKRFTLSVRKFII